MLTLEKLKWRTDLWLFSYWNDTDQSSKERRRKLPGFQEKAHLYPRKLRLQGGSAESRESRPAAPLSKCQRVICHLFKAEHLHPRAECCAAAKASSPQEATSWEENTHWPPSTSSQDSHSAETDYTPPPPLLLLYVSPTCCFSVHSWLMECEDLPTSPCPVESS